MPNQNQNAAQWIELSKEVRHSCHDCSIGLIYTGGTQTRGTGDPLSAAVEATLTNPHSSAPLPQYSWPVSKTSVMALFPSNGYVSVSKITAYLSFCILNEGLPFGEVLLSPWFNIFYIL